MAATTSASEGHILARGPGVWALAVGQTLGYACLYYIFAALILAWQQDLGWDKATLALGPTLAIILSAVLAPFMGRFVDRGYGPELLTAGAGLGAVALIMLAMARSESDYLVAWSLLGVAQAASLYEVCFAFLIRRLGPDARAAIVRVTLVAGFASTLAFPAGAYLSDALGWRGAVWIAAGIVGLVMLPLHLAGALSIWRNAAPAQPVSRAADKAGLGIALRRGAFWLLAGAFALVGLNHWMLVNFLVPIFIEQGASTGQAVLAASLVGPSQVAGRLLLLRYEARIGTARATALTIASCLVATALLWLAGVAPVLIFLFALTQGAAMGIMTILRPVMISEVLGPAAYGTIAGVIQIPGLLASAMAPLLGAVILGGPGIGALLALSMAISLAALVAVAMLRRMV